MRRVLNPFAEAEAEAEAEVSVDHETTTVVIAGLVCLCSERGIRLDMMSEW